MKKKERLTRVIDAIGKVIRITDEEKSAIIDKYEELHEEEIIKDLALKTYMLIGTGSPYYDYALTVIRNYNRELCPTVEEMKEKLDSMCNNIKEGNMPLKENHKTVIETLKKYCYLFNQYEIDYYIVGALPCFLKIGQPLFRYHDDIDIMINEEDIPKLIEIFSEGNYELSDDRFPSMQRFIEMKEDKPPHTVLAQNKENEFHLGFFCFRREKDNSITVREYSHRVENDEVVTDVLERANNPMQTLLLYDDEPMMLDGIPFRTSSIEGIYNIKDYTRRPKDIGDMVKLEPFIDKQKLTIIKEQENQVMEYKNVQKESKNNVPHL